MTDPRALAKVKENINRYKGNKNLFDKEVCGYIPTKQQEQANDEYIRKGKVVIKSGHDTGKTRELASTGYHQLYCYPHSLVVATAPTVHQLNDILFPEMSRIRNKSLILKQYFDKTITKIFVKGSKDTWFMIGIPSSNPDAIAGFHQENLLVLLDEAPGIKESAFPVIEGALAQIDNKCMMVGNPVRNTGYFRDCFLDPEWAHLTFSSIDSGVPGHDPNYAIKMGNKFGITSNVYKVRVLGEFPSAEDDSIMEIDLISYAMNRDEVGVKSLRRQGGCDVARYGEDKTVIYIRYGNEVVDQLIYQGQSAVWTQNQIVQMIKKHGLESFVIDETGMGGPILDNVIDTLDRLHIPCNVIGIKNNQLADDPTYKDAGTEMYFNLKEALKYAKIPNDDELLGELSIRKYFIDKATQSIKIVDKETMRKEATRLRMQGYNSPDKADALALCFYEPKTILTGDDDISGVGRASNFNPHPDDDDDDDDYDDGDISGTGSGIDFTPGS